jgi:hypothetical protein
VDWLVTLYVNSLSARVILKLPPRRVKRLLDRPFEMFASCLHFCAVVLLPFLPVLWTQSRSAIDDDFASRQGQPDPDLKGIAFLLLTGRTLYQNLAIHNGCIKQIQLLSPIANFCFKLFR